MDSSFDLALILRALEDALGTEQLALFVVIDFVIVYSLLLSSFKLNSISYVVLGSSPVNPVVCVYEVSVISLAVLVILVLVHLILLVTFMELRRTQCIDARIVVADDNTLAPIGINTLPVWPLNQYSYQVYHLHS